MAQQALLGGGSGIESDSKTNWEAHNVVNYAKLKEQYRVSELANNVVINFKVDESLCDNLYFKDTDQPLVPMPASYYTLASDRIAIPKGQIMAGVEVQLTDDFFADEKSISENYVIPLLMTNVQGADSILQGKPVVENPVLTNAGDWSILPQNFVLYAVKYVNPWFSMSKDCLSDRKSVV